uniref:Uncharacterized protein n=1 Tax=Cucumis sativus TaxID=3659 RepID=A0A0A0KHW4_CUCSA
MEASGRRGGRPATEGFGWVDVIDDNGSKRSELRTAGNKGVSVCGGVSNEDVVDDNGSKWTERWTAGDRGFRCVRGFQLG